MSLRGLEVAKPISAENERIFTPIRKIREPGLLGFHAFRLLARRQPTVCQTHGSRPRKDERAWRRTYYQRLHFWRSARRRLPRGGHPGSGRVAATSTKGNFRGGSLQPRSLGALR